ncbi:MAG: hypothetical protein KC668_14435 [Myxococcales bacterium]|nr:hypothetical protein [Myxococcales bacterium]
MTLARASSRWLPHSCALLSFASSMAMGAARGPDDFAVSDMAVYVERALMAAAGTYPRDAAFQSQGEVLLILGAHTWLGGAARVAWIHAAVAAVAASVVPRTAARLGLGARGQALTGLVAATWFPTAMYTQLYLGESVAASLTLIAAATWLDAFVGRAGSGVSGSSPADVASVGPPWHQAVAGLALGLACVFRPNLQLTVVLAVAWIGCAGRRHHAAFFTGGATIGLAFAYGVTRALIPDGHGLAENGGFNFYMSVAPIRQLASTSAGGGWAPIVNAALYSEAVTTDVPLTDSGYFYAEAWRLVTAHPGAALVRWGTNLWCSAGAVMTFPGFEGDAGDTLLSVCAVASAVAAVVGAVGAAYRGTSAQRALVLAAITSSVITCALFMGTPRARYPFDVIFLLCGAAQVSRLFRRRVPTGSDSARRGG